MSKNIVDSVLELNSDSFGLLPTRRQIDWNGGYVNGWNTKTFYEYVRSKNSKIILERDHSGPMQGSEKDMGYATHMDDANYFDIIHLDPWKWTQDLTLGIKEMINSLEYINNINPNIKFEILTEETIRPFTENEITNIIEYMMQNISKEKFDNIVYIVIQSGVGLDLVNMKNTGNFSLEKLKKTSDIIKSFGKKVKEHNGDYLSYDDIKVRFENGMDSINIGPELAQIETLTYLNHMNENQIDEFYEICLNSKKWERWVSDGDTSLSKKELIKVCGHYCFDLYDMPNVTDIVKENIKNKLKSLP